MQKEIEIDVKDLFSYLLKRWVSIAVITILAMLCVFGGSKLFITPEYESQSMIYITTGTNGSVVQNMLSTLQAGNALTADYKTLATSKPVLEQVITDLKLETTYSELKEKVSTENPDNTRILIIKVRDTDPKQAKLIADKLTEIEIDKIADIMDTTPPNVMQWGDIQNIPVSSPPVKNALYTGFVVFILILAFYAVRFIQNDTINSSEDIEKALNLRNLAEIPYVGEEKKGKRRK